MPLVPSPDPPVDQGDDALTAYWLNAYNQTVRASLSLRPRKGHLFRHRRLFRTISYRAGGYAYSLDMIEHGMLRRNRRPPYRLRRTLGKHDPRLQAAPKRFDPRIHFALNCGARSCPPVRPFTAANLNEELDDVTRAYLKAETRIDRDRRELVLPGLIRLYRGDFAADPELIEMAARALKPGDDSHWVREHALSIRVTYSPFDWRMA